MARNSIIPKQTQQYDIVQAKTPEELVRLVSLKTRFGWKCLGGMTYAPENKIYESSTGTVAYPYCQSVFREITKPSKK